MPNNKITVIAGQDGESGKICTKCKVWKSMANYVFANGKPGARADCNDCRKAQRRANYESSTGFAVMRRSHLKNTYGISQEEYDFLLEKQGGVCAICHRPQTKLAARSSVNRQSLCIDHCHETGRVRGLLCHNCNVGLGYFEDKVKYLYNAVIYLENEFRT